MDLAAMIDKLPEPRTTADLGAFVAAARARLAPGQLAALDGIARFGALQPDVMHAMREGRIDVDALRRFSKRLAKDDREQPVPVVRQRPIARVLEHAATKPAVTSAVVWQLLGAHDPAVASHLVQLVRERAGLPTLRRLIAADEPRSLTAQALHVPWFVDRQCEDAAAWAEDLPAVDDETLAATSAANAGQRAAAPRIPRQELVAFLQQAAKLLLHLSTRKLDPLGFPLERNAQLVVDPPLAVRLELATWARRAGHAVCLPGELVIAHIPIRAPWPLALELVAVELGRGICGGAGLLLRIRGTEVFAAPTRAPMMLCLPGEPIEERGGRCERWLAWAYPHAVDAWRVWC
jgi:hypothetical protein